MKTILAALDNSQGAQAVLAQAVALAQATRARLVLFRAGNVSLELEATRSPEGQQFVARIREEVRRDLEGLRRALPAGLESAVRVEAGPAAPAACEAARAEDADLVVVGSHGLGERVGALGAVAVQILAECRKSVLVVYVG